MFRQLLDRLRHRARLRTGNREQALGRHGEDLAHRYLEGHGLRVVARNYRAPGGVGEIDIVARDGETIVFVEVKSRSTEEFGSPDRAVGAEKERHLLRAALDYVRRAEADWASVRFDIVNVVFQSPPAIQHRQDVLRWRT
ncbi:MAG: YraN family protein [Acidobacteria bacterium]|nr:YraN family protein [Acidobacteriota bacterium]